MQCAICAPPSCTLIATGATDGTIVLLDTSLNVLGAGAGARVCVCLCMCVCVCVCVFELGCACKHTLITSDISSFNQALGLALPPRLSGHTQLSHCKHPMHPGPASPSRGSLLSRGSRGSAVSRGTPLSGTRSHHPSEGKPHKTRTHTHTYSHICMPAPSPALAVITPVKVNHKTLTDTHTIHTHIHTHAYPRRGRTCN